MQKSLSVFISYSHKDRELREELEAHLSNLKRQNIISSWYDGDIVPGTEWEVQILEHLKTAQIILLLLSADFMASNFCYSIEMKEAIARHDAGEACVIPILLRPTDLKGAPFAKLKMLPTDAKAVTRWPTHDDAFENILLGIRKVLDHLTEESVPRPPESSPGHSDGDVALKPEVHSPAQKRQSVVQEQVLEDNISSTGSKSSESPLLPPAQAPHSRSIADVCDKLVSESGLPKVTDFILTALITLVIEERINLDFDKQLSKSLRELLNLTYKNGVSLLEDARAASKEEAKKYCIQAALSRFRELSIVETSELLTVKTHFFSGVCFDLLGERRVAFGSYERAYMIGKGLESDLLKRSQSFFGSGKAFQELKYLQEALLLPLSKVLNAYRIIT